MSSIKRQETKLVPVPSVNKIPERDVDKSPILEAQHLGIDFGGLTAVNEFNMAIGRTEIAGLIGPNGAGKTTLLIAHRISTVEQLDKIIFIEDGRVEAVGPHDELYRTCNEYRRMVDLQKLEDEVGGDGND